MVAFTENGERLVGQLARRQAILNPKGTIYSAKRFIGRHYYEISEEAKAVSIDVVPGDNGEARFDVRGKKYAPEEISALVLRKLVDDASKFLGEKVAVHGEKYLEAIAVEDNRTGDQDTIRPGMHLSRHITRNRHFPTRYPKRSPRNSHRLAPRSTT